jgi:hypothetical protein
MKSYPEENNLHYLTFPPNSEKPMKEAVLHLPPDKPAEFISSSLEDLRFSVTNARQVATQTAPSGQTYARNTLTGNKNSQETFKLHIFNHMMVKVEMFVVLWWPSAWGMP